MLMCNKGNNNSQLPLTFTESVAESSLPHMSHGKNASFTSIDRVIFSRNFRGLLGPEAIDAGQGAEKIPV